MLLSLLSLLSFQFFVILTNSIELVQHTCIHHELQHDIQPIDIPLSHQAEGRILQDAYQNIRIHFDLTHLKKLPPEFLNYMTKSVIPPAKNYLEKTLKVIPNARNLSLSNFSTICANNVTVPSLYHKEGVDADLVLFVQIVDEPTKEFIAFASPCIVNRLTKRPLVGRLVYNTALFQPSDIDVKIERDIIVTLHEITHVLGFSSAHFSSFINPATNVILTDHISTKEINGKSTTVLNVEPLTNRLKEHFGCSDVDGAYLEDEGGPGSAGQHFERRIFYNEYMTASPLKDARISEFTLALLEGSGWYQVDYSMAEKLIWGKNKGCGFIDGPCLDKQTGEPNFEEFCSPLGKPGYSWTRRGAGACGTSEPKINPNLTNKFDYWKNKTIVNDQFLDNCPAFFMFSNFDCEDVTNLNKASLGNYEFYGYGSKNFMGTLSRTKELSSPYWYCFKPICDLQPSGDYRLKVNIGLSIVTCEKQEDISVPGLVGALFCPDPNEYCTRIESEGFCRRGCSGRGKCIDKKCQCEDGWTHHDCSQKIHVDNCTRCEGRELLMNSCYGDKCVCNPQTSNCRDAIIEELLRTARARISKKGQKSRRLKPTNPKRR